MTNDELEAAIAKAKGWRYLDPTDKLFTTQPKYQGYPVAINPDTFEPEVIPDWATDITAAWELVEEITAANENIDFYYDANTSLWHVRIGLKGDEYINSDLKQNICHAWLAWKEQK